LPMRVCYRKCTEARTSFFSPTAMLRLFLTVRILEACYPSVIWIYCSLLRCLEPFHIYWSSNVEYHVLNIFVYMACRASAGRPREIWFSARVQTTSQKEDSIVCDLACWKAWHGQGHSIRTLWPGRLLSGVGCKCSYRKRCPSTSIKYRRATGRLLVYGTWSICLSDSVSVVLVICWEREFVLVDSEMWRVEDVWVPIIRIYDLKCLLLSGNMTRLNITYAVKISNDDANSTCLASTNFQ